MDAVGVVAVVSFVFKLEKERDVIESGWINRIYLV